MHISPKKYVTRREAKIKAKAIRKALKLQAAKIEARLVTLNGERKENVENWLQSVRKDLYEQFEKTTNDKIAALQQKEDQRAGRNALFQVLAASGGLSLVFQLIRAIGWVH